MGYSTKFAGSLKFTHKLSAPQLKKLNNMFCEDCRDHPEWGAPDLYYIDLKLTPEHDGIAWNGAEKTYDLDKLINVVLVEMRKDFPKFGLSGQLLAQGEDINDRWTLVIGNDGYAHKQKIHIEGTEIICPNCDYHFILALPSV